MAQASRALMRLNLETRAFHAAADAPWIELTGYQVSRRAYTDQLVRVYGFEGPLEAALAYTPHLASAIDLRQRARSGLLAQDLLALDLSPAQITAIPQCHVIAPFANLAEAFGWLYVLERASLVHDPVRRHVVRRLPQLADACAYLAVSERRRWAELGEDLDRCARTPRAIDQMVSAAHGAFRCALEWYQPTDARLTSRA
jgi:heme oxygenase